MNIESVVSSDALPLIKFVITYNQCPKVWNDLTFDWILPQPLHPGPPYLVKLYLMKMKQFFLFLLYSGGSWRRPNLDLTRLLRELETVVTSKSDHLPCHQKIKIHRTVSEVLRIFAQFLARLPWVWEYKRKQRKIPKKEREKEKEEGFSYLWVHFLLVKISEKVSTIYADCYTTFL